MPPARLLPERLPAVLHVLYLLFNEGYGNPAKAGLSQRAIRLARVLAGLMPDEPEAQGMLALMLHDARRAARIDEGGHLRTLDEQDRSRWDQAQIAEGATILKGALRRGQAGPFQSRRPSPPAMPPHRPRPGRTGRRSPGCTIASRSSRPAPSST